MLGLARIGGRPKKLLWNEIHGERDTSDGSDISLVESDESGTDDSDDSESDDVEHLKTISWNKIDPPDTEFDIKSTFKGPKPGVKNCPPRNSPSLLYFYLFLTPALWVKIVENTNLYAQRSLQEWKLSGKKPEGPITEILKHWTDVSIPEMKSYFSLLMCMSISVLHHVKHYWIPRLGLPYCIKTMPYTRFKAISAMLHFDWHKQQKVKGEPGYDCFYRISSLLTELNTLFKMYFTPQENIAIDESRIGFKRNCPVVVYLPNRKHPFCGIKRFDVCDSKNGYILHTSLYLVKNHADLDTDEFNSKYMIQVLSESDLLDKGYNLCIENVYSNLILSENLLSRGTFLTATYVGENSQILPILQKKTILARGETVHFKNKTNYFVAYKSPRSLDKEYYISNINYTRNEIKSGKLVEPSLRKNYIPKCNQHVPNHMGTTEKTFGNISCTRTTTQYWRHIFYYLVDICTLNAWILHSLNSDKKLKRVDFVAKLIRELEKDAKGEISPNDPETDERCTSQEDSEDTNSSD